MAEHEKWQKLMDKNYVGEWCFEGITGDLIVTISDVKYEEVLEPNTNRKKKKAVVYFKEIPEKMVFNVSNSKTVSKIAESNFIDKWIGTKIALYFDHSVTFGGQKVGGVRVRPNAPAMPKCAMCGGDIAPAGGLSSDQVAQYTLKKYGRALCGSCATKINNGEN